MLGANENKPIGKSGQRDRKAGQQGKKAKQRSPKPGQQQDPKPDQLQDVREEITVPAVSIDFSPTETSVTDTTSPSGPIESAEAVPVGLREEITVPAVSIDFSPTETSVTDTTSPSGPIESAEAVPVGFHTIANAYGDYTRKSLEQTKSFFEKLTCQRSFVTAFELQIEFARKAYETFAADSQKIRELHSELARQRLRGLEGFMEKMTQTALSRSVPR